MKTFLRYLEDQTQINGAESPTLPVGQGQQGQTPPVAAANMPPTAGNGGKGPGQDDAKAEDEFNQLSNSLQTIVKKLISNLTNHKLNHQRAMDLFAGLTAQIAQATGLSAPQQKSAMNQGIKQNSDGAGSTTGGSPPMQPMANG